MLGQERSSEIWLFNYMAQSLGFSEEQMRSLQFQDHVSQDLEKRSVFFPEEKQQPVINKLHNTKD